MTDIIKSHNFRQQVLDKRRFLLDNFYKTTIYLAHRSSCYACKHIDPHVMLVSTSILMYACMLSCGYVSLDESFADEGRQSFSLNDGFAILPVELTWCFFS